MMRKCVSGYQLRFSGISVRSCDETVELNGGEFKSMTHSLVALRTLFTCFKTLQNATE